MSVDEAIALLRRGQCFAPEKRAECQTCAITEEAMRVLVAEGARRGGEDDDILEDGVTPEHCERIAREVLP